LTTPIEIQEAIMNYYSIMSAGILTLALTMTPRHFTAYDGSISLVPTNAFGKGNGNSGDNGNSGNNGDNGNSGNNGNNGNNGSNGNSGNNGNNGKSADRGKSSDKSASRGTKSRGKQVGKARADFAKNWASRFGALNAFRASKTAYAKASKRSQVGRIAAYDAARQSLATTGEALKAAIEALNEELGLDLTPEQIAAYKDATVGAIEAAVDDKVITQEVAEKLIELSAVEKELAGLQETVNDTFAAAATKESSEAVRAELDRQLDER
jgi:hypothetical protein